MEKCEQSYIKLSEKTEAVTRQAKIQEYNLRRLKEKLEEKGTKVEEFKAQKSILAQKRNEMKSEVQRKKEEYLIKFNKLMKGNQIKDISSETLTELFPGNTEIIKMFEGNFILYNEDMKNGNFVSKKSRIDFSKTHTGNKNESMKTISDVEYKKTDLPKKTRDSNSEEKISSEQLQKRNKTIESNSKPSLRLKS